MTSAYGYIVVLVGLSFLLAIAGVDSGMGNIMEKWFKFVPNADNSLNMSTLNSSEFSVGENSSGTEGSDSLSWIWAAFDLGALVTIGIAWATRDIGQVLKSALATIVLTLGLADFTALITYASTLDAFGGIVRIIAGVIYIPLGIGFIFALPNWIGGGQ